MSQQNSSKSDVDPRECPLTRPKYSYAIHAPLARNVLTDWFTNSVEAQTTPFCDILEMNMVNCLEAYGYVKSLSKCADYVEDYRECTMLTKQRKRAEILAKERDRQYRKGLIKEHYEPPPKMGSYIYDRF